MISSDIWSPNKTMLNDHPEANFMSVLIQLAGDGFINTDELYTNLDEKMLNDDGCTATVGLIIDSKLYVAHVGDSRAVLGNKDGTVIALTNDHKPNRNDERKRIENVGGTVVHAGTWRVAGVLAVSRSFGNRLLKQFIVASPEIAMENLHLSTKSLIIASDGLWDVYSNEEAFKVASSFADAEEAARTLVMRAYERGSYDNISCIVCNFDFSHEKREPEEDEMTRADTAIS